MSSAQQQLLATPSHSSVLAKGHVEEEMEVGSGLVSLRQGEVQEQERELGLGQGQGQEGAEEGEARGEVPAAHSSLDTQVDWARPVEWVGTVRERNVAGADVGNRLYAGKKRMFKGHKWERVRERRVGRTKMLLGDMDKRIQRFKGVRYCSRLVSGPSLPPFESPLFFVFLWLTDFSFISFCILLVPC